MHRGRLGTNTVTSSSNSGTVTSGMAVPAGWTVIGGITWSQDSTSIPTVSSATDSSGNTYTVDTSAGTGGGTASCAILRGRVTTPLSAGSTITVTTSTNRLRWCLQFDAFDDVLLSPLDRTAVNHTPGSSSSLVTGTTSTTSQPNELLVACFGFGLGGGAVATLGTDWSGSAQVSTSVGSTDRALQLGRRYVAAADAYAGSASLSVAADYSACIATYRVWHRPVGMRKHGVAAVRRSANW